MINNVLGYNLDNEAREFASSVANPNYPRPDRSTSPNERMVKRMVIDSIDNAFYIASEYVVPLSSIARAYISLYNRSPGEDNLELSHIELLDKPLFFSYIKSLFEDTIN